MSSLFWFDGTSRTVNSIQAILSKTPPSPAASGGPSVAALPQCQILGCFQHSSFTDFCTLHSCPSSGCRKPLIYKNIPWCEDHGCPVPGCKNNRKCANHKCPGIIEYIGCENVLAESESFCHRHRCPFSLLEYGECKNSSICPDHSCMVLGCRRVCSVPGRRACDEHSK